VTSEAVKLDVGGHEPKILHRPQAVVNTVSMAEAVRQQRGAEV
jgi:hypothetical protein